MAPRVKSLAGRLGTVAPRLKQTMSPDSWRTRNQSSTARGYGYKWQKARATYLDKHPFCAFCLRDMGISYDQDAQAIGEQVDAAGHDLPFASVVDHKIAHEGDQKLFWDSSNWQSSCEHHHNSDAQRRDKERNRT